MNDEKNWELEAVVIEDNDGSILGYSKTTNAFEIYGQNGDLAKKVAQAEGLDKDDYDEEYWQEHYLGTAQTRRALGYRDE